MSLCGDFVCVHLSPTASVLIVFFSIHHHQDNGKIPLAMIQTMKKLKSGYINGTRVMLGQLSDFLNTSAITDLSFLGSQEDGYPERLNQGGLLSIIL